LLYYSILYKHFEKPETTYGKYKNADTGARNIGRITRKHADKQDIKTKVPSSQGKVQRSNLVTGPLIQICRAGLGCGLYTEL